MTDPEILTLHVNLILDFSPVSFGNQAAILHEAWICQRTVQIHVKNFNRSTYIKILVVSFSFQTVALGNRFSI